MHGSIWTNQEHYDKKCFVNFYLLNQENVIFLCEAWSIKQNHLNPMQLECYWLLISSTLGSQTPMLTRNRLSSIMNPENFKSSFLAALEDQEVVERYKLIFEPLLKSLVLPLTNKLSDTVTALTQTISSLTNELAEKDSIVRDLRSDVSHLQIAVEDLEQHDRKDSMRILVCLKTHPDLLTKMSWSCATHEWSWRHPSC